MMYEDCIVYDEMDYSIKSKIDYAVSCIIDEIRASGKCIMFIAASMQDGLRIARENIDNEIIILSERIIPNTFSSRQKNLYFVYVIYHEVAHALLNHKLFKFIDKEANKSQEIEADERARHWMKIYCDRLCIEEFTEEEIKNQQDKNIQLAELFRKVDMESILNLPKGTL